MVCEGEVKNLDNHWIWDNGNISIVVSGVDKVFLGKGISRCHPCTRCDLPVILKSCKNRDQRACRQDNFLGFFIYDRFL